LLEETPEQSRPELLGPAHVMSNSPENQPGTPTHPLANKIESNC